MGSEGKGAGTHLDSVLVEGLDNAADDVVESGAEAAASDDGGFDRLWVEVDVLPGAGSVGPSGDGDADLLLGVEDRGPAARGADAVAGPVEEGGDGDPVPVRHEPHGRVVVLVERARNWGEDVPEVVALEDVLQVGLVASQGGSRLRDRPRLFRDLVLFVRPVDVRVGPLRDLTLSRPSAGPERVPRPFREGGEWGDSRDAKTRRGIPPADSSSAAGAVACGLHPGERALCFPSRQQQMQQRERERGAAAVRVTRTSGAGASAWQCGRAGALSSTSCPSLARGTRGLR